MKTLICTLNFILFSVILFAQNENPYIQFGYEAPIMPEKNKPTLQNKSYLINEDTTSSIGMLALDTHKRTITFFDRSGSILLFDTLNSYSVSRWLSPDPAGQFDSPYNGMGNLPNMSIDKDGGYIYIATSNYNQILRSLNALYSTKQGRKFINKFINNRNADVYINWGTTRNVSSTQNQDGSTTEEYAGGATLNQYMESGTSFAQSPFYDSQTGKIDFSAGGKLKAGKIGIGDFQNFNGKLLAYDGNIDIGFITLRNGASGKKLTSILGHEMGSHIYYLDRGANHASFYGSGQRVPGLFGMTYPTNSFQAQLNNDINALQNRQILNQLGVMAISTGLQQLVRSFATDEIIRIVTPRYCHIYFD